MFLFTFLVHPPPTLNSRVEAVRQRPLPAGYAGEELTQLKKLISGVLGSTPLLFLQGLQINIPIGLWETFWMSWYETCPRL